MRIFVAGGTGLIGTRLVARLVERGDMVMLLTRRPDSVRARSSGGVSVVEGDATTPGDWMKPVAECDAVINLVGESLFARRWNGEFKALLRDSRVRSTENIVRAMTQASRKPVALVNASAIGYYGPQGDEELTEQSPSGTDFLAGMCVAWEEATRPAEEHGVRVVRVRTGVVLDKSGGALAQMLPPFKFGLGGPIGSGKQWMSWIHAEDEVAIILFTLDRAEVRGPINATAPEPCTNRDFSKALGRALGRPAFFPVPKLALKLRFGEVADVLTTGQRVLPARAVAAGYAFRFPSIDIALQDLLRQ